MVVEVNRKNCIVLTPDGEYRRVALAKGQRPRLGQEIQLPERKSLPYLKQLIAAAAIFVVVCAGLLWYGGAPTAAAYLTIDINPSIELAVSNEGKVISARAIDDDGEKLLNKLRLNGLELPEAVKLVIAQAVKDTYIQGSSNNVIMATFTVEPGAEPPVGLDTVYEAIRSEVDSSGVDSDIIIEPVEPQLRREATSTGISTGRYLLLNKAQHNGVQLSLDDVTTMSLGNLEKEKKVNLVKLIAGENGSKTGNKEIEKEKKDKQDKQNKRGIYYVQQKKTSNDKDQDKAQKNAKKKNIKNKNYNDNNDNNRGAAANKARGAKNK